MLHALATPRIQGSPLHRYKMSSGRLCYGNAANGVSAVPSFSLVPLSPGKGGARRAGCVSRCPGWLIFLGQSAPGSRPHSDLYLSLPGGLVWVCFCPVSCGTPGQLCLVPHWVQLQRAIRIMRAIRALPQKPPVPCREIGRASCRERV